MHYGHTDYAYHNAAHYQTHLEEDKEPSEFMLMEPMWHSWNDFGAIFGVKIKII